MGFSVIAKVNIIIHVHSTDSPQTKAEAQSTPFNSTITVDMIY